MDYFVQAFEVDAVFAVLSLAMLACLLYGLYKFTYDRRQGKKWLSALLLAMILFVAAIMRSYSILGGKT